MKVIKESIGAIFTSLLELLVGILLLTKPIGFTSVIIIGFGIVVMLSGIVNILRYFVTDPASASESQYLFKGLISLLGGGFCAFRVEWFLATFPVMTLLYGVAILIAGLKKLQRMADGLRLHEKKWYLYGIGALLSLSCGVMIMASPFSSTAVMWMFTGISLITEAVFGGIALVLSSRRKKEADDYETVEAEPVGE